MSNAADPSDPDSPGSAPLRLTEHQEAAIHVAACELVAAAVLNLPGRWTNRELAGAGRMQVLGAFVSLKRRGQLRACCGFLGEAVSLPEAIERAATRTAREDLRFPPISPSELEFLDLETWLLHSHKPMTAKGHDRVRVVETGRHGLQIVRGANRGLLLPSVATEQGYAAEQFLQQVCLKANLPATAWLEDETELSTFEGVLVSGTLEAAATHPSALTPGEPFSPDDLKNLARGCAENVFALLRGATPNFYLPGCPEGNVSGLAIFVAEPGESGAIEVSKLALRPGMALQSSLYNLAQGAAAALRAKKPNPWFIPSLNLALAILFDPAMHGTVESPDLRGVDAARRAVLVVEGPKSAWVYNPDQSPQDLLNEAARLAKVTAPAAARVISLGIAATDKPLAVVRVPEPQPGPNVRPANQAGRFYPGDQAELQQLVDGLLSGDAPPAEAWPAVMVPHAGLKYSGKVAADTFRRVTIPDTVIVLCPKHTVLGVEWAIAPHDTWSLPGGSVPSDPELARHLAAKVEGLELDGAAHFMEHAIEVELPLIARLHPQAKVVGIALGGGTLERLQKMAADLAEALADRRDDMLLVISSDMNHFAPDAENRRLDEMALAALETLDPAAAFQTITQKRISMCGLRPAVVVMEVLRRWNGLTKSRRVAYATTADTTGDKSRVVGYAGMLFA